MGAFPSGQRGQTVNLLSTTSVVRIHPLPPNEIHRQVCLIFLFLQSPGPGFFLFPSDEGLFLFLSVPDGVLIGVLPPAGDFSRGRKVTKSPLRTKVLRTPFGLLWGVCTVFSGAVPADSARGSEFPCFRASARSLGGCWGLCICTIQAFPPWGKVARRSRDG